ncbi:MAG: hypothetical protein D6704_06110 [Nitrospirae bacterium]|nr:MAG: hypothetical protein D6704_06110 [Nitrospirota bacterium]
MSASSSRLRHLPFQWVDQKDGVIVKRGCSEVKISGSGAAHVLRIIFAKTAGDGATPEEICCHFAQPYRATVRHVVDELTDRRFLVNAEGPDLALDGSETPLDILYWHFDATAHAVADRLNQKTVALVGVNAVSAQLLHTLTTSGVRNITLVDHPLLRHYSACNPRGWWNASPALAPPLPFSEWLPNVQETPPDCIVVAAETECRTLFQEINAFCLRHSCHWLPVYLHNVRGYIGPFVIPGETACYECLLARWNSHTSPPWTAIDPPDPHIVGFHPSMAFLLGDLAAFELTRRYSQILPPSPVGTLIEVNLLAMQLIARKVLKVPRCPSCSSMKCTSSITLDRDAFLDSRPDS